jgi:hypothetical protein
MPRLRLGLNDLACLRVCDSRRLHQLGPEAVITIVGHPSGMRSGAPSVALPR